MTRTRGDAVRVMAPRGLFFRSGGHDTMNGLVFPFGIWFKTGGADEYPLKDNNFSANRFMKETA